MRDLLAGVEKVSVHGGHSGQFCHHAADNLENVVAAYVEQGFSWAGITEHMPPAVADYRYPDEVAAGLEAGFLRDRFERYFVLCRELREQYRGRLEILTAFETEAYPGAVEYARRLIERFRPDYLVGSVHHVKGICIDFDRARYEQAAGACGGIERLYCAYFDTQYGLLKTLNPAVVGHFDLIRIFDLDYRATLNRPEVQKRIRRNLNYMRERALILDLNLRGYDKGAEPYPSRPILETALEMGITVVPGDDSHGVDSVGRHYARGIELLRGLGASLDWRRPAIQSKNSSPAR